MKGFATRRVAVGLVMVGGALMSGAVAFAASSSGAPASARYVSDTRAVVVSGNLTSCDQVGYQAADGWLQFPVGDAGVAASSGGSPDGAIAYRFAGGAPEFYAVEVAASPGTVVATVIVKGGDKSNVYGGVVPSMISPLNKGLKVPAISHWFACYRAAGSTPSDGSVDIVPIA